MRNLLYRLASLLGDIHAAAKGRIVQRMVRKQAIKQFSKMLRKAIK